MGPKRTPRPERANGDQAGGGEDEFVTSDADARVLEMAAATPPAVTEPTVVGPGFEAPPGAFHGAVPGPDPGPDPMAVPVAGAPPERRRRRSDHPDPDPDLVKVGRRQGRRVRRIVRRIDLWSVLKLAVVLYTCLYAAVMATLALLWAVAYSSGQIEKVQSFMSDVGLDNYRFYGDQMWRACAMIGAIGVLAATVITVLTAALVNVISETTGGIRFVVIEEDPRPRRRPSNR